jgi:acyl-CoA oxidase
MSEADINKLDDLPKGGPLEDYRKRASFDWKKMKLFLEDIELIQYKVILFIY